MTKAAVKDDIVKAIEGMTVMELAELVDTLKDKFGVTAMVAAGAAAPAAGAAAPAEEAKDSFDIILASFAPDKKIQTIKTVREITSLGLKEAKDLVEGAPKPLKTGIPKDEAESIKKKLEDAGAKAEIK